jgi:hypothetical protein
MEKVLGDMLRRPSVMALCIPFASWIWSPHGQPSHCNPQSHDWLRWCLDGKSGKQQKGEYCDTRNKNRVLSRRDSLEPRSSNSPSQRVIEIVF